MLGNFLMVDGPRRVLLLLASAVATLVVSLAFDAGPRPLDSAVGLTLETAAFYAEPATFPVQEPRKFINSSPVQARKPRSTGRHRKHSDRFKVIVWATDGSEVANNAFPYAKSIAQAHRAKLIVVHVDEFVVGRGGGYSVNIDESQIQAAILTQVDGLKREGLDACLYVSRTWVGGAPRAIANIAIEVDADLIIGGTRGRGLLRSLLTGSVIRKLTRMAHCPVLSIPTRSPHAFLL
jgi:nucleotide-binding universal stress UspA family protein